LPRYGNYSIFQYGSRRHLGFLNLEILTVVTAKRVKLHQCAEFCGEWSNCCGDMAIFRFFQDGGASRLEFLKFEIFNGQARQQGRTASPCQTLWRSVKVLLRYGDFSIFPRWRLSNIWHL